MKILKFTDPINYGEFKLNQAEDANGSGIYIWGFQNNGEFIPYYVGKSESSVYHRINNHFQKIHLINTYMIFSIGFYGNLKANLNKLKRKAKPYKNISGELMKDMIYLNNEDFLVKKYSNIFSEPHLLKKGITSQLLDEKLIENNATIQNVIDEVFSESNLFISYLIFKKENEEFKKELKIMETFVKFKMPNPVISDSGKWKNEYDEYFELRIPF